MRRSTVDCVRRSNQTEEKGHNEQTATGKQEVRRSKTIPIAL